MNSKKLLPLRILASLPLPVIHIIGKLFGWILWLFPNQKRKITYINLRYCFPQYSSLRLHMLACRSLTESMKTALEMPALMSWEPERVLSLIRDIRGKEHIESAMRSGKGAILSVPHLGNWEIIGFYCSNRYPMTSLYRKQDQSKTIDQFIRQGRERLGARLVPTDASGVRAIYQALAKGELIGMLPDQNPGAGKGVFVPFFGHKTNTMVLLSRLASKSKAIVINSYAERLSFGRGFRLHFIPANDDINNPDLEISATELNRGLEYCIREKPEQYWWSYKRFSVTPPGELSPYKVEKMKRNKEKSIGQ